MARLALVPGVDHTASPPASERRPAEEDDLTRLRRATTALAATLHRQKILVDKFQGDMAALGQVMGDLRESVVEYRRHLARIEWRRLHGKARRLARIMEPHT